MSNHNAFTWLKSFPVILGIAAAGIILGLPSLAQAEATVNPAREIAQEPPMQEPPAQEPPMQQPPAQEPPAQEPPMQEAPMGEAVDSEELQQFANVVPQFQSIQQSAEQEVMAAIEESGLSRERFSELYRAQESPEAAPGTEMTPEEQQSFSEAFAQIQAIEESVQTQRIEVLEAEGLEPERFNEILVAVQQDPSLQQQVQQLMTE